METETARRPLKTRQAAWANQLAQMLVKLHVSPNAISVTSIFFAAGAGVALYFSSQVAGGERALMLILAVAGIQGRLLCNMLDGMVAIEGGRQTKSGEIFNDLPDRVADALIFICAGYAARMHFIRRGIGLPCRRSRHLYGLCAHAGRSLRTEAKLCRPDGEAAPHVRALAGMCAFSFRNQIFDSRRGALDGPHCHQHRLPDNDLAADGAHCARV
jgi:hypothetical protein